jgi:hypothetical protein
VWVDVSGDAVSELYLTRSASTITLILPQVRAGAKRSGNSHDAEGTYVRIEEMT